MLVKDELLDRVVARVREQLAEDQAPQVEEFARQYYAWITAEDLADRSPIDLYGAAVGHWTFARRTPGEPKSAFTTRSSTNTAGSPPTPYRDRHGRHAVPRGLGQDGDKPRRVRDPPHAPPIMNVRRDDAGMLVEVLEPDTQDEEAFSTSRSYAWR